MEYVLYIDYLKYQLWYEVLVDHVVVLLKGF